MELFVNNLTTIDFSYYDGERGLTGESLIVDVSLKGALDDHSMVMDFSTVKKWLKKTLDETIDHTLVLPTDEQTVRFRRHSNQGEATFISSDGTVKGFISGPAESFCIIDASLVKAESIESFLNNRINKRIPDNPVNVQLTLRGEICSGPYYHYTHGLKKHSGNCQRIAHGHRSAIQVFIDGVRSTSWEFFWAERFRDRYLMSREDIVDVTAMSDSAKEIYHPGLLASAYTGSQGKFEILIEHDRVEILPEDTTVEQIALYLNAQIKYLQPEVTNVIVQAYEGVEKGARY